MNDIRIIRRVGTTPAQRGSVGGQACPDVLKIEGGYLVIGGAKWADTGMNELLDKHGATIGTGEMAVVVPDAAMHAAALDIVHTYAKDSK